MKHALPFVLVAAAAFLLAGCTTRISARLAKMPDGQFKTATLQETGKFTSTTIKLTDAKKDNGLLTATSISVSHTNPWLTKFDFEATGYVVQLTPAEKKKPLPTVAAAAPVVKSDPPAN